MVSLFLGCLLLCNNTAATLVIHSFPPIIRRLHSLAQHEWAESHSLLFVTSGLACHHLIVSPFDPLLQRHLNYYQTHPATKLTQLFS
jgi:hypothetical protein